MATFHLPKGQRVGRVRNITFHEVRCARGYRLALLEQRLELNDEVRVGEVGLSPMSRSPSETAACIQPLLQTYWHLNYGASQSLQVPKAIETTSEGSVIA